MIRQNVSAADVAEIAAAYRQMQEVEHRIWYGTPLDKDAPLLKGETRERLEAIGRAVGKRPMRMSIMCRDVVSAYGVDFWTIYDKEVEE